jgi:hypothetical protein
MEAAKFQDPPRSRRPDRLVAFGAAPLARGPALSGSISSRFVADCLPTIAAFRLPTASFFDIRTLLTGPSSKAGARPRQKREGVAFLRPTAQGAPELETRG